jgi:hypothetical protein
MKKMYANIEIANGNETVFIKQGLAQEAYLKMKCVIDFSTTMLCVNETIKNELKLTILEKRKFQMKDSVLKEFEIVSNVLVKFKNRQTCCNALVLPFGSEIILGMIPLNGLNAIIKNQNLVLNPITILPSVR